MSQLSSHSIEDAVGLKVLHDVAGQDVLHELAYDNM